MQHKGVVKFFAVTFILVCLFQLSFTFISYYYSGKADKYSTAPQVKELAKKMAQGNPLKEEVLYDSISKSRLEYFNDSMASVNTLERRVALGGVQILRPRFLILGVGAQSRRSLSKHF